MKLYLASRRSATTLIAALTIGAAPALIDATVGFPSIIGSGGTAVLSLTAVLPCVLAILTARSFTNRRTHLTATAVRDTGWMDALFLLTTIGAVALATWVVPDGDWTVARNTLFLVGLTALGTALTNAATGAALITFITLFILTYGTSAPASRFIRILQPPADTPWPLIAAAIVTTLAAAALTTRAARPTH